MPPSPQASSSIGRVSVSKTEGWGFETLLACHYNIKCATYMIDKIKLVLALILVAAGVAGFYLLSEHALVVRILAVLAGIIAAVVVFWSTPLGREAFAFVQDSAAEARRVVWPTRKETIQTTVAVFVLVMVMAVFLWLVDIGFLWGVKMLMGRGA